MVYFMSRPLFFAIAKNKVRRLSPLAVRGGVAWSGGALIAAGGPKIERWFWCAANTGKPLLLSGFEPGSHSLIARTKHVGLVYSKNSHQLHRMGGGGVAYMPRIP
jgi:hypothetical protein